MSMIRTALAAALGVALAWPAAAQGIPKVQSPEEVGFLSTRLKRLSDRLNEGVKNNELPGAVVLIARNGKIVMFESYGFRDKEAKVAMTNDTIFRIASMTKPIVTLAAMMLMEEGKLTLADRVSMYIPAFADTKVAVPKKKDDGTVEMVLEPQYRPMTVHDLMRHTSGLTYGAAGANPVKQSYLDMKVADRSQTNAEMADKLAKLALLYQPGTTWEYSMSTDVLGRVVEVASGMPLDKFIEERITKPLKMGDTAFEASADKKARGAKPMKEGPKNEVPAIPDVTEKFTWRSGGGGMVSTAADYARFLQMFANGGQLDGVRLISRKTIDLMTADALPPDIKMGADMFRFEALEPSANMGQGFGLGFAVRNVQGVNPLPGSPNDYFWGGAYGTYFWHDPRERLYVVFMMQSPQARLRYRFLMRDLVYQAMVN
ncbi:MAG: class A beta-lactamase-related serine hydrolase [Reyranella sp.]|uniref:serine hydrolase domain-containing protein n=1 Tax=Reyranella sp. TaxID=1929291 RepID=UPI00121F2D08|nr:serine hydrolase domain-containing protein [Reyranella sp.]TAJ91996.1 MAG: class A beta-lactamase-related serine hydrolase [Reyranella sp.]TBR29741.1 MAG: class A beta-lactamase-related serine hydrolase [Reyranella sp.]